MGHLDDFIGENVRTISRASTARSGNTTCSGRPLPKVLREIEAIPHDEFHASMLASVLEGDEHTQPQILETALSDVEEFINANARTISGVLTARSGNLTARSMHSASSRPITKILRDISALKVASDDSNSPWSNSTLV